MLSLKKERKKERKNLTIDWPRVYASSVAMLTITDESDNKIEKNYTKHQILVCFAQKYAMDLTLILIIIVGIPPFLDLPPFF